MVRPADWWVLDLDADPTPGEPVQVRRLAREWEEVATDAALAERDVRALAGEQSLAEWVGDAADVFRAAIDDFPGQLAKCADSYGQASDALRGWAADLDTAQGMADRALSQGRIARDQLDSLQAQLATAAGASVTASGALSALTATTETDVPLPDPDQVREATRRAQAAAAREREVAGQVTDAEGMLAAAKRLADQARGLREDREHVASERIRDASDAGIEPNSFWENLRNTASQIWDTVITVAKVAVAVLGIVVLIIGGPLAWVVLAAALVILVDTLVRYAQGNASLWDIGLALLECIPGFRGFTTAAKIAAMARNVRAAGRGALAGLRTVGTGLLRRGPNHLRVAADTSVDISRITPRPVWRTDHKPLYRADLRGPDEIFRDGFRPKDASFTDLDTFVHFNRRSAFVSTSYDPNFYRKWEANYRFDIDAPGGIDVNRTLPKNINASEAEISFPGGIRTEYIRGARPVNPDKSLGDFIPNPHYVGSP